jgi:hypothetical protein
MNAIESPINHRIEMAAQRVKDTEIRLETTMAKYLKEIDKNMDQLNSRIEELEKLVYEREPQKE